MAVGKPQRRHTKVKGGTEHNVVIDTWSLRDSNISKLLKNEIQNTEICD